MLFDALIQLNVHGDYCGNMGRMFVVFQPVTIQAAPRLRMRSVPCADVHKAAHALVITNHCICLI